MTQWNDEMERRARELDAKATPGPWNMCGTADKPYPTVNSWHKRKGYQIHGMEWVRRETPGIYESMEPTYCADAQFIAESRTLLPAALAEIDRLRKLLVSTADHLSHDGGCATHHTGEKCDCGLRAIEREIYPTDQPDAAKEKK